MRKWKGAVAAIALAGSSAVAVGATLNTRGSASTKTGVQEWVVQYTSPAAAAKAHASIAAAGGRLTDEITTIGVARVMAGAGFRRGHHDTRTPLYVGFGTALINLVIEVVLLIVLDFGIGASALSTVIAQWVGALVYVALVAAEARRHQVGLAPHLGRIGTQLRVGSALIVRTVEDGRAHV